MKVRGYILSSIYCQIGKGENIDIWHHSWYPTVYLFEPFRPRLITGTTLKVAYLIDSETRAWKRVMTDK